MKMDLTQGDTTGKQIGASPKAEICCQQFIAGDFHDSGANIGSFCGRLEAHYL